MYAGFWKRFFAFLIDSIIVSVILIIVMFACAVGHGLQQGGFQNMYWILLYLFSFAGPILYWTLFECSSYQATPGKMALGIKVTDMRGQKLGFAQSLGRNLGKIISNLTFYIGYMLAGFTVRRQALHDKMSDCLVIDKNADPALLQPLPRGSAFIIALAVLMPFIFICFFIGMMAAIAMPQYTKAVEKSRAAGALSALGTIREMQKIYQTERGFYASSEEELEELTGNLPLYNNENYTYKLLPFAVTAQYNGVPAYTFTACYETNDICVDTSDSQFKHLKTASPKECCKGGN